MRGDFERYSVLEGLLEDPLNRLCVEHILAKKASDNPLYPPAFLYNGQTIVADLPAYLDYMKSPAQPSTHTRYGRPTLTIAEAQDGGFFVHWVNGSRVDTLGPYMTESEALQESLRILQDDLDIKVCETAPWSDPKLD